MIIMCFSVASLVATESFPLFMEAVASSNGSVEEVVVLRLIADLFNHYLSLFLPL